MIVLFDMDSTLISVEACDMLAEKKGMGQEISQITQKTMDGELDFDSSFPAKCNLLAPSLIDQARLSKLVLDSITPGFETLIKDLLVQGHRVGILTQGYQLVAEDLAKSIDKSLVELTFGLVFEYDEAGMYVGFPDQALKYEYGKSQILIDLKRQFPGQKVVLVGDSVGDMIAGRSVDKFIGYGGNIVREKVESEAKSFCLTVEELSAELHSC